MSKQLTELTLRDEIEQILHLNGCQQRTAGYNEGYDRRDINDDHMEKLEKDTLNEVMLAIEKHNGK